MAYKVFSNGNTLNGSELNTYLMNQAVISFASTTARDAAITSPLEGQLVWLEDTNKYVYYTGSAWTDLIVPTNTNAIINGGFDIWQRGTSFTSPSNVYTADRWKANVASGDVISQQTFTPGTAPVTGYEGQYFCRIAASATAGTRYFFQPIEDVRSFAGQTVTLSFWAKVSTGTTTLTSYYYQSFGSGGSADNPTTDTNFTLTTSWQRFSYSTTMPAVTGKTIGAGSFVQTAFKFTTTSANIEIWGVQVEAGSVATPFRRNAPSLQGELAACQRYYFRMGGDQLYQNLGLGMSSSTTDCGFPIRNAVTMRVAPTSIEYSTLFVGNNTGGLYPVTAAPLSGPSKDMSYVAVSVSSGLTSGRPYVLATNNSLSGFIAFSAEL